MSGLVTSRSSFTTREQSFQTTYFETNFAGKNGYKGMKYRLHPDDMTLNLAPSIRDCAIRYFDNKKISWHTHANHGLSSQICCLNFLMPLAEEPKVLSAIVALALGIPKPRMLEVEEGPDGRPWFIGFEWNGKRDYLNESGPNGNRSRGANCTSFDALVQFEHDGGKETLPIEWKYTESYNGPISASGNPTRLSRYRELVFAPNGPVRGDLGLKLEAFFYEPFYQLLRQQMLAFQMQQAGEDGADRVRVLHISPAANHRLHRVTSPDLLPFGDDAFDVFRSLLVRPENLITLSTESLFGPLLSDPEAPIAWTEYLSNRYQYSLARN